MTQATAAGHSYCLSSAFPMSVPSLSWQNDHCFQSKFGSAKGSFRTCSAAEGRSMQICPDIFALAPPAPKPFIHWAALPILLVNSSKQSRLESRKSTS
eukprot:COSAG06_NODE_71_length_25945_cov_9.124468_14_plen_98_part_00